MSDRKSKAVEIGKGKFATVFEVNVRTMRELIGGLDKIEEATLRELFTTRYRDLLPLVESSLTLPEGTVFDDLTLPQIKKIWEDFKEINPDFFELAGSLVPILEMLSKLESLSALAADSSSGDTSMSGIMDGLFSSVPTSGSEK